MAANREQIKEFLNRVRTSLRSTRGRSVLTYLMFVAIAFVFWVLMSLDSEVQRDFDIPVELVDIPDSVTVITPAPASLSVSVKGKGSQMLRYIFGQTPTLKLHFELSTTSEQRYRLTRARLDGKLRDFFGGGISVMSCRPDSVSLVYTTSPGVRIPLKVNLDVKPALQYIISGDIKANMDSVTVYSNGDLSSSIDCIETEQIVKTGVKDTTRYTVKLKSIPGARIIPDRVTITVPVEPLISKKLTVPVEVLNVPDDERLITFPSKVEVNYLVPISAYEEKFPIKVFADYNNISTSTTKLPLSLSIVPGVIHDVVVSMDSVEYVKEKK